MSERRPVSSHEASGCRRLHTAGGSIYNQKLPQHLKLLFSPPGLLDVNPQTLINKTNEEGLSSDGVWSRHRGSAAAIHQLTLCPCFDRIVLLPLIPETCLEESRRASVKHLIKKSV